MLCARSVDSACVHTLWSWGSSVAWRQFLRTVWPVPWWGRTCPKRGACCFILPRPSGPWAEEIFLYFFNTCFWGLLNSSTLHAATGQQPTCSFPSRTLDFFPCFMSLWFYLWLTETSHDTLPNLPIPGVPFPALLTISGDGFRSNLQPLLIPIDLFLFLLVEEHFTVPGTKVPPFPSITWEVFSLPLVSRIDWNSSYIFSILTSKAINWHINELILRGQLIGWSFGGAWKLWKVSPIFFLGHSQQIINIILDSSAQALSIDIFVGWFD